MMKVEFSNVVTSRNFPQCDQLSPAGRCDMDYSTWIPLLIGAAIVGSGLAYGVFSNRQCDAQMRPTKQDRIDEMSWRKELLGD
jgi:hypothetical protein